MFKNYLIVALRFFSRQRSFSIINIAGLTIGLACSLLIFLYVEDELRYDRFHSDADRIHRIGFQGNFQGKVSKTAQVGFPVADAIQSSQYVESVCRLANWETFPVSYQSQTFTENYLLLADQNFFRFFSFKLIEGNPDSVLRGLRKVVISESAAKKYFNYQGRGDQTPLGKTLVLAQGYTAQISGIAADPPLNSHFHFTLILSLESWEISEPGEWLNSKVMTYYKIKQNTDATVARHNISHILQQKLDAELTHLRKTNLEEYKKQGNELTYFHQPLSSIHLHSNLHDEIESNGNIDYIYLFSSIAVFITILACINFMNLTTAQSATRAKEVAVRKAVGAQTNRLIGQFLIESYLYVIVAVVFAIALLFMSLAPFNFFTGKSLTVSGVFTGPFLVGLFLFIGITGLVAGSYPSFYLTQFNPIDVMKGNLRAKMRNYGIRNFLVVFQFFISAGLIVATLVVYEQLRFIQHANVGFEKENLINLLHTKNLGSNAKAFKDALLKQPGIISASYSNRLPPNVDWQSVFRPDGQAKDFSLAVYEMDYDHAKTMGYKMVKGRFFDATQNDSMALILNETAARILNLKDFEGKQVFTVYDQPDGKKRNVIGIIQDFNFQSLREPIQPLAIILGYEPNWEMAIRVENDPLEKIRMIETTFKKFAPEAPFEYSIVEVNFEDKHRTERRIGMLFVLFTVLAIVIACLGLFGLASFTAAQQRKSIGIRKVLGASNTNIIALLNKDFLLLVVIANAFALPVSYWVMSEWLSQFAYHADIPWYAFVVAIGMTFTISLISITAKAFKAAQANPVDSLRSE